MQCSWFKVIILVFFSLTKLIVIRCTASAFNWVKMPLRVGFLMVFRDNLQNNYMGKESTAKIISVRRMLKFVLLNCSFQCLDPLNCSSRVLCSTASQKCSLGLSKVLSKTQDWEDSAELYLLWLLGLRHLGRSRCDT